MQLLHHGPVHLFLTILSKMPLKKEGTEAVKGWRRRCKATQTHKQDGSHIPGKGEYPLSMRLLTKQGYIRFLMKFSKQFMITHMNVKGSK